MTNKGLWLSIHVRVFFSCVHVCFVVSLWFVISVIVIDECRWKVNLTYLPLQGLDEASKITFCSRGGSCCMVYTDEWRKLSLG